MSSADQAEIDRLIDISRKRENLYYTESDPLPVRAGPGRVIKGTLTRLTGDKSYAASSSVSDADGTMVTFSNVTRSVSATGGSGVIIGSKMTKNTTSINNVAFRLWLYQINFGSVLNPSTEDGDLLQIRWRRRDDRIGYLDFTDFISGYDCAESYAYVGLGQRFYFPL